jgi:hypothetical protein
MPGTRHGGESMKNQIISRITISALFLMMAMMVGGCEEDEEYPVGGAGDLQQVTIVILENNTDTRVAGASIILDDNSNLSCTTADPGGDSGGDCTFMLKKVEHSIKISKVGYRTTEVTFRVTSLMTFKYFSISNN